MSNRLRPAVWILALLIFPLSSSTQNASPSPDFDGSGTVDFPDFLQFARAFGSSIGEDAYDRKYDLNGNGKIDFPDFVTFARAFGKPAPPSGGGDVIEAAYARFNEERQKKGLSALQRFAEGDSAFIPVREFLVGCEASVEEYEELQEADLHGIGLSISTEGSECGLKVVTYHVVPPDQRMRVERAIWECFSDSRDMREPSDVSCGGRFTFLGRHVRWLPDVVSYTIVEGEGMRDKFRSHVPWIEQKLKVKVSEATSPGAANLFLHFGVQSPAGCPDRYGCAKFEEVDIRQFATVYTSAPDEYFSLVLKHELLHAILPMGHLPEGNDVMSVQWVNPSQIQTLTEKEEKLLELYTHPYLRADMTMGKFRQYLVIEDE